MNASDKNRNHVRKAGMVFFPAIIFLFATGTLFAFDPPQGGNDVNRYYSPEFLSGGASVTSSESPQADAVNPAASGGQQRTTLDAGYSLITDFQSGSGIGHAANLGASVPTKYGVFTGSLHLLSTPYTDTMNFGTGGGFNFSFAKDLYPNFYFGTGLGFTIGSMDRLDWGLWLDLGIMHLPGTIGFMKDFRWGIALQGLGKWYDPIADESVTAFPSPFTLAAGMGFDLVQAEAVRWGLTADLSFPSFQNVQFDLGTEVLIKEFIGIRAAFSLDVREIIQQPNKSFIPSFGVFFNFKTKPAAEDSDSFLAKQGWDRSDIKVQAAALPLYSGRWALGAGINIPLGVVDQNPPEVIKEYAEPLYLSPNNDGKNDDLLLPVTIEDERYVKGYALVIENAEGEVVRTIENKDQRPENVTVQNVIDRLLYVKEGIPVPENLRWDGYGDDGSVVSDGEYRFYINAWDDNGNMSTSGPRTIYVDITAPALTIETPEDQTALIFSPDKDGNKDELVIAMEGSVEDLWTGTITNAAGETMRTITVENGAPEDFVWDGRNDEDILVPDGVYHFTMTATDRAVNNTGGELTNIIVNTQRPEIGLAIDHQYFSPNGDGVQDVVTLERKVQVTEGILSWVMEIRDASGAVRRRYDNTEADGTPAESLMIPVAFDGVGGDGGTLPEGKYTAVLTLLYENGYNPEAVSPDFFIDVTAPSAEAEADYLVFSPNGDGNKDTVGFDQQSSSELSWGGAVYSADRKLIREYSWAGEVDGRNVWDGRTAENDSAPDGEYTYFLYSVDRAGNYGASVPVKLTLSTIATPIAIAAGAEAFSPNGNGKKDTLELLPELEIEDGVEEYTLAIVDERDSAVRTFTGRGRPDTRYTWDGRGDGAKNAPDGTYHALLDVVYINGNNPVARTGDFILDRIAPSVDISADYRIISPNGDGNQDVVSVTVHDISIEDEWTGTVSGEDGRTVAEFSWVGRPDSPVVWDGKGQDGKIVPDGRYTIELSSTDKAANTGRSTTVAVTVDTAETPVLLTAELSAFSPNGDGVKDEMPLNPQLRIETGVKSYELEISGQQGNPVRRFDGSGDVPGVFSWDGRTAGGGQAPDGTYTAGITVTYENGNVSSAKTRPFVIDTVAPRASVTADLAVFSPNNDGRKDIVRFTQTGTEEESWTGSIIGGDGGTVKSYVWKNRPVEELSWDGFSGEGSAAPDGTYRYTLQATDAAGNTGTSAPVNVDLVTVETPILLTADLPAFSPNGDGIKDRLTFTPELRVRDRVASYLLEVRDGRGGAVRQFSGNGLPPAAIIWDGKGADGTPVSDGRYTAVLTVEYTQGNRPETKSGEILLDTVFPSIEASVNYALFSPGTDGLKDEVRISQQSSLEDLWTGVITNDTGETVRDFFWKGTTESITWDGTDTAGNRVPDGEYTYTVASEDAAGNKTVAAIGPITSDTRYTSAYITANKTGIAPKGRPDDTISFSLYAGLRDGISSWSVSMVDQNGRTQKRFSGGSTIPSRVSWDGKNDQGRIVESEYTAVFTVIYEKGDRPEAKTPEFMVDISPPATTVRLFPQPFSPDNDGVEDDLSINLAIDDPSGVRDWKLLINDPTGREFIAFEGRGKPANRIIWNGISGTGELVQAAEDYPYILTATDNLGNQAVLKGLVPVDVLVIRDGDRLKIRISSINFEPYRADLVLDNSVTGDKNKRILGRLAEILKKYRTYKIRVEGHAAAEYWNIPGRYEREEQEELKPLSKARADSVRNYLVQIGIDQFRLSTEGLGGTQPVVPHGDLENRWKNRRVEFILIKP